MTTAQLLKEIRDHDIAVTFRTDRGQLYVSVVLDNQPLGWTEVPEA